MLKRVLLIAFILCAALRVEAQELFVMGVDDLFRSATEWGDSLKTVSNIRKVRSSTGRDTLTTNEINTKGLTAECYVQYKNTNLSGNDSTTLEIALFRGNGFPDSSGWEYKNLGDIDGAADVTYVLSDSSWWKNKPPLKYKLIILERDSQQSDYMLTSCNWSSASAVRSATIKNGTGGNTK